MTLGCVAFAVVNNDDHSFLELLPSGAAVDGEGELVIGGCRVRDVAQRYGTPTYLIDESSLRSTVSAFRDALDAAWGNGRVHFASKAFPSTAIYRLMAEEGVGVDVAGGGELKMALAAGVDPETILVHGNAKTDAELAMALEAGVGLIVIDNFDDIDRIERLADRRQSVLVRVIPDVHPDTHDAMATGQRGSKFGLSMPDAEEALKRIRRSPRLHLDGIHTHIGSQITDLAPFTEAVASISALGDFDTYDLGGGLGARYTYLDNPPTPQAWIGCLTDAARRFLPATSRILLEPGRSMVARSGVTLYRVVTVKHGEPTFVAVDGGMGDNLDVSLYGQRFEATVANRLGWGRPVELVGRHCESGDRLVAAAPLVDPAVGDVVVVAATGAYCFTMANNYNGALKPPVVFARGGATRLVVRRETYEDLLARDETGR